MTGTLGHQSQVEESSMQQEQNESVKISQTTFGRKQNQARPERTDDVLHQIKHRTGYRGVTHRVEKRQPTTQKMKAKQQEEIAARALRNRNDAAREAAPQTSLPIGSEDERTEVEETQTDGVHQFLASQSDESEKQVNVLRIYKRSDDEVPERIGTGDVEYANDPSNDSAKFYKILSTREQRVDQVLEPAVHEHSGPRLHDLAQQHNVKQSTSLGVDRQDCDKNDVEHGMREVEKQIRSADDVADEVYDDSLFDKEREEQEHRNDESSTEGNHDDSTPPLLPGARIGSDAQSAENGHDVFPGGSIEPATDSSTGHHEPTQNIEALTFSEVQAESSEGSTSRDKRKAMYHETGSVDYAGSSVIPRIQVTASHAEGSDTAAVSEGAAISTDRHLSLFPGGALTPSTIKSVIPTLSKKRNLPAESEDVDVHLREPKTSNQAQLNSWEPFKETVDAVGRIRRDLDHARIYVTSSIEIKELSAQQHPNQERLWSWLKEDQELFDHQISSLLRKKFGFQVVCSDAHPQGRRYCSLEHMEYWNAYFGDNERGYWLAVLTPWRSAGPSREKVRKTYDNKIL
jgi:hypothetical protein